MKTESYEDVDLVERSRHGDRNAFGRIVERYQSLVCALTYSASGNLQASEDLAQVTFITAWCELSKLREPAKLKSWLCGIARNVTNSSFRQDKRTPTAHAETLEVTADLPADTTTPLDHVISKEEEAILWGTLCGMPETYREPLVLFYRQNQSVTEVSEALGVTEDVVRQRLSRGRAMLSERVASFVETALSGSGPGKAFTLGVLAVLPVLTTSTKAAVIGATAAKGSAAAKAAAGVGLMNVILGPVLGLFGSWIGYRMSLDSAKSEREREFVKVYHRRIFILVAAFVIVLTAVVLFGAKWAGTYPRLFAGMIAGVIVGYVAMLLGTIMWSKRKFREFWAERPAAATRVESSLREYQSKTTLLGLPLVHVRLNEQLGKLGPVKAWIAVGDCAFGVLLAFGGVAIAPISDGAVAIGLLPWGGLAIGVFAVGGLAVGCYAFGGVAIGWLAFGGCAMAWQAAVGGMAFARNFAVGGFAYATHANDQIAKESIGTYSFFRYMQVVFRYINWLNLLWMCPLIVWWRAAKKRPGRA